VTSSFVIVGDTERERSANAETVRRQIAFYASTRTYTPVLAAHGWEGISPELHRKSLEGDWKGMSALITDEMLEEIAVSGTYESIGKKLRERYAGLLDRVSLYQPYQAPYNESRRAALVNHFKT
jgi:alkanesulfonate monooxygenase SsuD/methylene tetrahydromethanopterin reductase-like flavin-dependent oxidoreductase (luciferase family)